MAILGEGYDQSLAFAFPSMSSGRNRSRHPASRIPVLRVPRLVQRSCCQESRPVMHAERSDDLIEQRQRATENAQIHGVRKGGNQSLDTSKADHSSLARAPALDSLDGVVGCGAIW